MCVPTSVPSTDHTTVTFGDWEKASQATTFATESKRRQTSTGNGSSLSPEEPARLLVNPVFSASAKAFAYRHWRVERKEKRFSAQEKTLPPKQKGGCGGASVAGGVYLQSRAIHQTSKPPLRCKSFISTIMQPFIPGTGNFSCLLFPLSQIQLPQSQRRLETTQRHHFPCERTGHLPQGVDPQLPDLKQRVRFVRLGKITTMFLRGFQSISSLYWRRGERIFNFRHLLIFDYLTLHQIVI